MRKTFKWIAFFLAVGFLAAQFKQVARTNPPFDSSQPINSMITVPPDVHAILTRACADCHSNQTEWPWYSHIAPTSWFVVDHVNHGRKHINFSTWVRPRHEPVDSIDRLKAICREVREGDMPLTSYKLIHWNSWLSGDDVTRICEWSLGEQIRLSALPK